MSFKACSHLSVAKLHFIVSLVKYIIALCSISTLQLGVTAAALLRPLIRLDPQRSSVNEP